MIQWLIHRFFLYVIGRDISSLWMTKKVINKINEEYKDDESWQEGKKNTLITSLICLISLIILSCLIS